MRSEVIHANPRLADAVALLAGASLPTEDLTEVHCATFFYSGPAEAPTGLVGLELFGAVALLRSLVVTEAQRGTGAGSALLALAEAEARARGVRELFLLTTTAEAFFKRHGDVRSPRESVPEAIRATREFSVICPSNSACMKRHL